MVQKMREKFGTGLLVAGLLLILAASITCLVMSIVFAYDIVLVYHDPIVNVANVTNLESELSVIEFYLRCDQAYGGTAAQNILFSCGIQSYEVSPHCNSPSLSYYYQTYAFASVASCPTGYLQAITSTVNLGVNLVALASIGMILLMIAVWTPCIILYIISN
jgi:hypothetical protein